MDKNMNEKVSALVDNELGFETEIILNKVIQDDQLKERWGRYNLIGEALRGNTAGPTIDLSSRISAALAEEPTVLAPKRSSAIFEKYIKPVAGFAVAATVAVVAILGLQPTGPVTLQSAPIAVASNAPTLQTDVMPVAMTITTPVTMVSEQGTRWNMVKPVNASYQVENSLNDYLVNHHEYAMSRSRQGMMSYVRIAGYDTTTR